MWQRSTLIGVVATLLVGVWMVPAGASSSPVTYKDSFKNQVYSGNDGSANFSDPWKEIGEANGPGFGVVYVWDHEYCKGNYCAKIGGQDADIDGHGLVRQVHIQGVDSAELCFDWGRQLLDDDTDGFVSAEVSPDGGKTWITLRTFPLDADDGGVSRHEQIDITEWAGPTTQIRFIGQGTEVEAYFLVDNVEIKVEIATTETTTTKPTTTTTEVKPTSTSPTTTTPAPERPTTTTTEPGRTTTSTSTTTTTTTSPQILAPPPPPPRPLPPEEPSPAPDIPEAMYDVYMGKGGFAVALSMPPAVIPGMGVGADGGGNTSGHPEGVSPLEGLMASFTASAENFGGNSVAAILLGLLIAGLAVRGLKDRATRDETT